MRSIVVAARGSAVLHPESAVASTAVSTAHESIVVRAGTVLKRDHTFDKGNHKVFIIRIDFFCWVYSASLCHESCIVSFYAAAVWRPATYYLAHRA